MSKDGYPSRGRSTSLVQTAVQEEEQYEVDDLGSPNDRSTNQEMEEKQEALINAYSQ